MLTDGHPCTCGVQQTDSLVGQLAAWNVAVREFDSSFNSLIQQLDLMMFLQHASNAPAHKDRFFLVRLFDLYHLKAAGQRRIRFDMLLVFGPCGCRNGAQFTTCQCGFQ